MEQDRFIIEPTISLHHDELYMYGKFHWISEPNIRHKNSLLNLQDNNTHNKLSTQASKKVKRAIKYLLYSAEEKIVTNSKFESQFKFKVAFITLTLSSQQLHTDQELKNNLLNQFFVEAKKKWNVTNYVWRMEFQKNGNIHFHILTDKFIPWLELRNTWNRIQNKLGYVDRYQAKYGKKQPNSTDIHSLTKIKNVAAYVTKYMSKSASKKYAQVARLSLNYFSAKPDGISSVSIGAKSFLGKLASKGREWACSRSLSKITGAVDALNSDLIDEVNKLKGLRRVRQVVGQYFTCVFFDPSLLTALEFPLLYNMLNSYLNDFFPVKSTSVVFDVGKCP